jgi:beta-glucosidase
MNNIFFLNAAMHGEYPKAFVGDVPYKEMGFHPGDEKIMKAPLDWVGFQLITPGA